MTTTVLPFITVAMPVRNEERFVGDTLAALLNQEYPKDRFEIIVADGGSVDRTREIVKKISKRNPQVILMSNPGRLPSSGRNVGFKNGKGELFLVIDGHCLIDNRKLLRDIADCFNESGADCLGRPQPFVIPPRDNMQKAIAIARASWLGHSFDSHIHSSRGGFVSPLSVGCAYKREVFNKIGYVDESFDACEDVEFNYRVERAGFKAFFSPKIAVSYYPRERLSGLWKQLVRYGEGRFQFMVKHPRTMNLHVFLPLVFFVSLFLGPVIGSFHQYFLWFYLCMVSVYLVITLIESIRVGINGGWLFVVKILSSLLVIHLALGMGMIRGFFRKGCIAVFNVFKVSAI